MFYQPQLLISVVFIRFQDNILSRYYFQTPSRIQSAEMVTKNTDGSLLGKLKVGHSLENIATYMHSIVCFLSVERN